VPADVPVAHDALLEIPAQKVQRLPSKSKSILNFENNQFGYAMYVCTGHHHPHSSNVNNYAFFHFISLINKWTLLISVNG